MELLKFIGRVLILTSLISSANNHIRKSADSIEQFKTNTALLDKFSNQYLNFDLPVEKANLQTFVKILGVFEAITVLLILAGDGMGACCYLISLTIELGFYLWPKILSGALLKWPSWPFSEQQQSIQLISLIGIALILLNQSTKSKGQEQ